MAADVNGDGFDDVVSWQLSGGTSIYVVLNDGAGGFADPKFVSTPYLPVVHNAPAFQADIGDVDGDGWLDIVIAGIYVGSFSSPEVLNRSMLVLWGDGSGSFERSERENGLWLGGSPFSLKLDDLNRDGLADAIVQVDGELEIFLSRGATGFPETPSVTVETPGAVAATGDFNGDGNPDVVIDESMFYADRRYRIYRGDGSGRLAFDHETTFGYRKRDYPWPLATGDFDGDGRLDLAALRRFEYFEGRYGRSVIFLRNSCPVRASFTTAQEAVRVGERLEYRARIKNISSERLTGVSVTPVATSYQTVNETRPERGGSCNLGSCDLGDLEPGDETFATVDTTLVAEPEILSPRDVVARAGFTWSGGRAEFLETTRIRRGVDLVLSLEMIGEAVLGNQIVLRLTVANEGAEPASAIRLTATQALLGLQTGLCTDLQRARRARAWSIADAGLSVRDSGGRRPARASIRI